MWNSQGQWRPFWKCHNIWRIRKLLFMLLLNSVQSLTALTFCAQWMVLAALLLCLSIMWFSFGLVTFRRQIGDDVREIMIKRPPLNFDQNCHFYKDEKSKLKETFSNGFKTIKWHVYIKKKYSESVKKVKKFNTLERPSWIVQFLGRGTLDFELFSIFSSKIGTGGIKSPIYHVIALIWNYALEMTLYTHLYFKI